MAFIAPSRSGSVQTSAGRDEKVGNDVRQPSPPSTPGTRFAVAPSGVDVRWSRKGNALFYLNNRTGALMTVEET